MPTPSTLLAVLLLVSGCDRSTEPASAKLSASTIAPSTAVTIAPVLPSASASPRDLLSDLTSSFAGDHGKATAELKTLSAVSNASGYGVTHVVDWYLDLEPVRKRYSEKTTLDVLAALLDIETKVGTKATEPVKYSIDNSARTDHWDTEALRLFASAGVGTSTEFAAMIAVARKISLADAQFAILSDRISSSEGINAFLQMVRKNLDNGAALGTLALKAREFTDGGVR